jgi:hypothetical protein
VLVGEDEVALLGPEVGLQDLLGGGHGQGLSSIDGRLAGR